MRAILKNFYSLDIIEPLSEFHPIENDNFGFWARMIVGEEVLGGEESFDVMICTPKWIIANSKISDIIFGRHYLIVFEYNYHRIYSKLKKIVERIEADTWNEIGVLIGRIGKWEFEDYQE
jgi:hypothetical protein